MEENDLFIQGEVLGIEPDAEYEGVVYGYYVTFLTSSGTLIRLFDPKMKTNPTMVGKQTKVRLLAYLGDIERIGEPKFGFEIDAPHPGLPLVYGQIESVDEWDFYPSSDGGRLDISITVNVDNGRIEASTVYWTDDPLGTFGGRRLEVGDFVKVAPHRFDVEWIELAP